MHQFSCLTRNQRKNRAAEHLTDSILRFFHFTPHILARKSRAYSLVFRLLSALLLVMCGVWGIALGFTHPNGFAVYGRGLVWIILAWLAMLWMGWHIWHSRTWFSVQGIHQSWIAGDRHVSWQELASVKLVRISGLDWLIAPRLFVRSLSGRLASFYTADAQMINEFARLAEEFKQFRTKSSY